MGLIFLLFLMTSLFSRIINTMAVPSQEVYLGNTDALSNHQDRGSPQQLLNNADTPLVRSRKKDTGVQKVKKWQTFQKMCIFEGEEEKVP